MDIPLPDELEWLEHNSHIEEDLLDIDPPELHPPEEEGQQEEPPEPLSPFNSHKRRRSESSDSPNHEDSVPSDEKRSKMLGVQTEVQEDWLRYSPQEESNRVDADSLGVDLGEEIVVSRYASLIDGDFLPVTAPSGGDRVYAKKCSVETETESKKLDVKGRLSGLISEPIHVLLQRVEKEAFSKALQASSDVQNDVVLPETSVVYEQLWVDKYSPNSFTELLSDEQTNREVLLWLKQWDSCVFGSEIRTTSEEVFSALRRHSSIAQQHRLRDSSFPRKNRGRGWGTVDFRQSNNWGHDNDNTKGVVDLSKKRSRLVGPPEQKILLLCGPPGLGKTTLAHVAAKHCGYRVVEINASDDRSTSTIESKILDVVQMSSVMADSRPKCLVMDEIDGALADGKGAVEVLLKMLSAEKKSDSGKGTIAKDQSAMTSLKKGRKSVSLSRPVICICNDLYAPALRRLRQVAKVLVFVQPTVSRVVGRLKYICSKEGMKTSSIALTALAEYTECDIRSCLNTLQFLNRKKEMLNVLDLSSQVVGRKDISRGAFDIWKEIFQNRKTKRDRKSNSSGSGVYNEFDFMYSLISFRADYELLLDGIHENFLQLYYHDPVMLKTVKCLDALGVSDMMHQHIMRTQQMSLHVYQPALAITIHRLIAQPQKPNIQWPKSYQRYRTTLMEKEEVLKSWHSKIRPDISMHLSIKSFIEDSISPILHILSPPTLKPVALHLLSEREKSDLVQLVNTMVSYFITYKNMKSDSLSSNAGHEPVSEASALSFDPPINDLINFKGYISTHYKLPSATRQVLVHEVEKQKILQVGNGRYLHLTDKENQNSEALETRRQQVAKVDHASTSNMVMDNARNVSNTNQCNPSISMISTVGSASTVVGSMKPNSCGAMKKPSRSSSSFFDRFRKPSLKGSLNTENAAQKTAVEEDLHPLLFKFNEHHTAYGSTGNDYYAPSWDPIKYKLSG
ncbi:chromosome transmission fidelity protein 18 [Tripterygium wilfordii]|uniref:Chromosome transmission fidelity protein 18 homolog n=1 Tax=Tripterygium wilfordii TaxID=458696 RepID=A0A7J7CRD0_TRIWF|nr:chromosome transmission fidelity protein 18 [Tripterygium wilfordii]